MRICLLTTSFPLYPGDSHGTFVYRLGKYLVRSGLEVSIVAPGHPGGPGRARLDGMQVSRFPYFAPRSLEVLAYGKGIPENLRNSPWKWLLLPWFMTAYAAASLKHARQCDLIHAHWTVSGFVGLFAARLLGKPLVVTIWGSDMRELPSWFNRMVLSRADTVIGLSLEMQHLAALLGADAVSIPAPVDTDHFTRHPPDPAVALDLGVRPGDQVVSFIGRLYDLKDPLTFLAAVPLISARRPNTRFLIVGDGALLEQVRERADSLEIGDRIRVTGARTDIDEILALTTVFTAISPIENLWSTTITEATAMGVPLVLTDAGHTREVFTDGQDCLLVNPRDPGALADAAVRVLDDPSLADSLVVAARNLHKAHGHDNTEIIRRHREVYARAMARTTSWRTS